ncbi:MAG: hypothetical protein LC737_00180 [Chloroflexi bacterium]|nr:hypothetical protein [Chloroflexota bacterium]
MSKRISISDASLMAVLAVMLLAVVLLNSSQATAFSGGMAKGEVQPGDDRGGRDGHVAKGEVQPGDDRGGHGNNGKLAKGEPQPGDDRSGHGSERLPHG